MFKGSESEQEKAESGPGEGAQLQKPHAQVPI